MKFRRYPVHQRDVTGWHNTFLTNFSPLRKPNTEVFAARNKETAITSFGNSTQSYFNTREFYEFCINEISVLPVFNTVPTQNNRGMSQKKIVEPEEHHKQLNLCSTRPPYRQGRKLTAVKVYTINDESQHLLIFGVPSLKLEEEVKKLCFKYGLVKSVKVVKNYPELEQFTELYHVHYKKLSSARFAKKKLDTMSFYGGLLHVCYAPELESIEETRAKLAQRRKEVHIKLKKLKFSREG